MQVAYLEMLGAGNRILVVDERGSAAGASPAERFRRLSRAPATPSFDQVMWLFDADGADAAYRVFNADGSEAEQCGNGLRCVAWALARDGDRREFRLSGPAGPVSARALNDGRFAVDMGAPVFQPAAVPFDAPAEQPHYSLDVNGRSLDVQVLSMGNPHCVLTVDDVASAEVETLGPAIERHPRFPARTNVGFMAIRSRDEIDLRVHERGVGETAACGTGACAAVVAAARQELVDDDVRVNLPGGQLMVSWRRDGGTVWLTGPADYVSEGIVEL